jgi:ribose transport system substrate-binding protein
MTPLHSTLSSLLAATVFSMASVITTQAHAQGATPAAETGATGDDAAGVPSLKGKRIGITAAGTDPLLGPEGLPRCRR